MKSIYYTILFFFLFLSCSSTQPVTQPCPICPAPTTVIQTVYKYDTVNQVDSFVQFVDRYDTTTINVPTILSLPDTSIQEITLTPSGGDDWPQVQAAINYNIKHHLYWINCTAGFFRFYSNPPIIADTTGQKFNQVSIGLRGTCPAKNTITPDQTVFEDHTQVFGIGYEMCEGCKIENIAFTGQYTFPNNLTEVQIDTLTFAQWDDGTCSTNNSSPYGGLVGDFASTPAFYNGTSNKMYAGLESYSFPGMGRGGSTGVEVENCSFSNFIADFVNSPAYQQNGEMINFDDCNFGNSRSVYCTTNAQQKENHLNRSKIWTTVHTIIDGNRYGAHQADGSICPMVDGMNIARWVHQFIHYFAISQPGEVRDVYAEGLYKIGYSGGPAGFNIDNCQFNLQLPDPGTPFPDFVYDGSTTTWTNTEIRVYGDSMRIILNTPGNIFKNGQITNPPVCLNLEIPAGPTSVTRYPPPTMFDHVSMFYTGAFLTGNGYDSIVLMTVADSSLGTPVRMVVNPDFTGYFITSATPSPGDLLLTQHVYGDDYLAGEGPNWTGEYPVGVVTTVVGDTVNLRHIGQGIHTGDQLIVYDVKTKSNLID